MIAAATRFTVPLVSARGIFAKANEEPRTVFTFSKRVDNSNQRNAYLWREAGYCHKSNSAHIIGRGLSGSRRSA